MVFEEVGSGTNQLFFEVLTIPVAASTYQILALVEIWMHQVLQRQSKTMSLADVATDDSGIINIVFGTVNKLSWL